MAKAELYIKVTLDADIENEEKTERVRSLCENLSDALTGTNHTKKDLKTSRVDVDFKDSQGEISCSLFSNEAGVLEIKSTGYKGSYGK